LADEGNISNFLVSVRVHTRTRKWAANGLRAKLDLGREPFLSNVSGDLQPIGPPTCVARRRYKNFVAHGAFHVVMTVTRIKVRQERREIAALVEAARIHGIVTWILILQDSTTVGTYHGGEIHRHLFVWMERIPVHARNLLRRNRSDEPSRIRLEISNQIGRRSLGNDNSKTTQIKWRNTAKL